MKKISYFIVILAFTGFISCLSPGESSYSPAITLSNPAKLGKKGSIFFKASDENYTVSLDSLHVNDTVTVGIILNGYVNNLTTFNVFPSDTVAVKTILPDSLNLIFKSTSDFKNGKFIVKDKINNFYYPLTFVAKKPVDVLYYTVSVTSDATKVRNDDMLKFKFPIKPKR